MATKVSDLCQYLDGYLHKEPSLDIAINGLQLGDELWPVEKMAFAVDASMAVFQRAVEVGADFLFVHHGFFWGKPLAITQDHFRRVQFLIENKIALYASHLPLDVHPIVGNNAQIAKALSLEQIEGFGTYKNIKVGLKGILPQALSAQEIVAKLIKADAAKTTLLPFGKAMVRSIAIVSGDMPFAVEEAIAEGVDMFISGEGAHAIYHTALEAKINVLLAGHYFSETFGPRAVMQLLNEEFGLKSYFLDFPTNL